MTQEQQRIAIHIAMGWHWQYWGKRQVQVFAPKGCKPDWFGHDKESNSIKWPIHGDETMDEAAIALIFCCAKNPLEDLNAMNEAEKTLTSEQLYGHSSDGGYLDGLCSALDSVNSAILATAAQRAEAFLKTINKWED